MLFGGVAQLVERQTQDPKTRGSNLSASGAQEQFVRVFLSEKCAD